MAAFHLVAIVFLVVTRSLFCLFCPVTLSRNSHYAVRPRLTMGSIDWWNSSKKNSKKSSGGVRINRCLSGLSRRASDQAVAAGMVTINSKVAECGSKVLPGDIVRYQGMVQHWQPIAKARSRPPCNAVEKRDFIYLKYWKPVGITCTSDQKEPTNIVAAGNFNLLPQRVFTVGRLDKDSSGLILLTSDGRVNNAMLNAKASKEKTYVVEVDKPVSEEQIAQLSAGVVITTTIQRDSAAGPRTKEVTAKTLPCYVKRVRSGKAGKAATDETRTLQFTLREGRNRQIRRMCEAVGLRVVSLHRTGFAGISLRGLAEGNWAELTPSEMKVIQQAIKPSSNGDELDY